MNLMVNGDIVDTAHDCYVEDGLLYIPFDTKSPFITSGIRIGTPASTSRGFKEDDMIEVGKLIALTIKDFEGNCEEVRTRVKALCDKHPLYN